MNEAVSTPEPQTDDCAGQPLDERVEQATKEIKSILKETKLDDAGSYLADVSEVFYKYGREPARIFVAGRIKGEGVTAAEIIGPAILQVIDALQRCRIPREISAFILKKLDSIQQYA